MNIYHHKAMELKYEGYSYKDISKTLGGKISTGTLQNYFAEDGMLYLPYLEYEAEQNRERSSAVSQRMTRRLTYLDKILDSLLQSSIKHKEYKLAFEIVKEMMDRAGFVVERNTRVETNDNRFPGFRNYEEYAETCRRIGIDPETGLSVRLKKMDQGLES